MDQVNWIAIGATLFGGGAMGALITAVATSYRNRKQVVRYSALVFGVLFRGSRGKLTIAIDHEGQRHTYDDLRTLDFQVANTTSTDFGDFVLGLTLPEGHTFISCEVEGTHRHHIVEGIAELSPTAPSRQIDLALKPFNRKDVYSMRFYISRAAGDPRSSPVVTTPHPVDLAYTLDVSTGLTNRLLGATSLSLVKKVLERI